MFVKRSCWISRRSIMILCYLDCSGDQAQLLFWWLWCQSVKCVRHEKASLVCCSWLRKARRMLAEDNEQFSHKQDKKVRGFSPILLVRLPTEDRRIILAAALMWWWLLFPKLISLIPPTCSTLCKHRGLILSFGRSHWVTDTHAHQQPVLLALLSASALIS